MAWLTGPELMDRVKAVLAIEQMDTPTNWTQVCADAADRAAADIRSILGSRGFTAAQIAAWDSLTAFNVSQGLFWALTMGGATKDFDDKFINKLDVREQLMTLGITILEEPVEPETLVVTGGELSTDADAFKLTDPDLARWRDAAGNVAPGGWPWR